MDAARGAAVNYYMGPFFMKNKKDNTPKADAISRRDLLRLGRQMTLGLGAAALGPSVLWIDEAVAAIPASQGYLLVDSKKCQGCLSCMLVCSLVNEGRENLSLSRIQIMQNSFGKYPGDLQVVQCRQCLEPACLTACPVGALTVDSVSGYIRKIKENKCIGCQACVQACPYVPVRIIWNQEKQKALKCDLCQSAPYWSGPGGPWGRQACVEVCPNQAIAFTVKMPFQYGDHAYDVNLRGPAWSKLGWPTD